MAKHDEMNLGEIALLALLCEQVAPKVLLNEFSVLHSLSLQEISSH